MTTVTTYIYLLRDSHGNRTSVVCEESTNTVEVGGMLNADGNLQFFNSDAYHLWDFCKENYIYLKEIIREEDWDVLWKSEK